MSDDVLAVSEELLDSDEPQFEPLPISEAKQITYAAWGEDFFQAAITTDRICGAVSDLAGKPIQFGPMGVGPGRIAKVVARGQIEEASVRRHEGFPITCDLIVPVDITFDIDLKIEKERYDAHLEVPIRLTARAVEGVRIFVDARPPHGDEVLVELKADGTRGELLNRIAGIEDILRRFVAKYVTKELDKPAIRNAREINVSELIDRAWSAT